ncbi:hypothetical protein D0862_00766 [Hortaea werneckii]|uniref:Eukaryotic translation initiation factor 4E n=3 Tax=Hortaea werneckii TaxID=91943 RepID=A0A3M7HWI2_HORWE|nr:hypothetical protein D0862_00766 [Hortaea werneckii]
MAEVAQPVPNEQVPLDTIPVSPEGGITDATNDKNADDGKIITVFDDPANFNVKHALQNTWTLWFTKPPSGKQDWSELLKEVITFDSVEEFWGIYNNITPASELAQKSDYHLFKRGVRPEWEDPQNKFGGRWSYTFKNGKAQDAAWLDVMLAAIGETLEDEGDNEVMGVVINIRKAFWRVGLWTRTAGQPPKKGSKEAAEVEEGKADREAGKKRLEKIGKRFKDYLKLPDQEQVEFSGHADSAHSGSSRAKAKFAVRRLSLKAVEGGLAEEEAYCSCLLHGYGEDRSYGRSIHACIVQLAKDVEHVAVQESMRRRRRS